MEVRIVGTDLPGRTCADPRPGGLEYRNVHVGVQRRRDVVDLFPADAPRTEWSFLVDAVPADVLRSAQAPGKLLVGTVRMQHDDGMPRCAAVRPPIVEWTVD